VTFSRWIRFWPRLAFIGGILVVLAGALFWTLIPDPDYRLKELLSFGRYHRYDAEINQAARRYGVPPDLIRAVIWRESRFHPDLMGTHGERGLMQITEAAAADWTRAEKIETFVPTDLFDPKVNIEAGTWYLRQALAYWADRDDSIPFALAEYNAGRSRVSRWVGAVDPANPTTAEDLVATMDFPATRRYLSAIIARYEYYRLRNAERATRPDL
jgi:soluble lytic murein transglycosylase